MDEETLPNVNRALAKWIPLVHNIYSGFSSGYHILS